MRHSARGLTRFVFASLFVFVIGVSPAGAAVVDEAGLPPSALPLPLIRGQAEQPAGPASPTLSQLRLSLTSTSAWAGLEIPGSTIIVREIIETSPGTSVGFSHAGVVLDGPGSVVVDAVYEIGMGDPQIVTLQKGADATSATGEVLRMNGTTVSLMRVTNTGRTNDNAINTQVSRASLVGSGFSRPRMDPRRLTLAAYYPWFPQGAFDYGYWPTYPTTRYETNVATAVRAMIDEAAGAGVDGFIVSYDGRTRSDYQLVFRQAESRGGFLVAPYLEGTIIMRDSGNNIDTLVSHAVNALAERNSSAFLRVGSRPVMFLYGSMSIGASQWRTAISRITTQIGVAPFVIGDNSDRGFGFDGFNLYNPNAYSPEDLMWTYWGNGVEAKFSTTNRAQRLWTATVSPGFDNRAMNPPGSRLRNVTSGGNQAWVRDREGGAVYDASWNAALFSAPEWIMVTSWNEWREGTQIQPDTMHGSTALDQTRNWTSRSWN